MADALVHDVIDDEDLQKLSPRLMVNAEELQKAQMEAQKSSAQKVEGEGDQKVPENKDIDEIMSP